MTQANVTANAVSYNLIIKTMAKAGQPKKAKQWGRRMEQAGLLSSKTLQFELVVKSLLQTSQNSADYIAGWAAKANELKKDMNASVYHNVMRAYFLENKPEEARLEHTTELSPVAWSGYEDGKYYAVKFMKKHEIIKLKQVDHINNEKRLMAQISYPFIVNMMGYCKDEHFVYIVMESINGGELFTHLRRARKFSDEQSKFYALQTAAAFAHIHSKNIIHRDLKPENILLLSNGYSKLTDFGFAKIIEPGTRTYTLCGTPEYIAPEVLLNKGHGKPVDWWTLGILIYEMICGQPPFCDEDPMGIYQKILAGKVYFPKYFDKNAKALVKKLLVADLSKRFGNLKDGSADILKHKWFESYELAKLENFEVPAPYKPNMKDENDTSNYEDIPDSKELPPPCKMLLFGCMLKRQWVEWMETNGTSTNSETYMMLMRYDDRQTTFWHQKMDEKGVPPSTDSFNLVLRSLSEVKGKKRLPLVEEWYERMQDAGCPPNEETYALLISAAAKSGQNEAGEQWFSKMTNSGLSPDREVYQALMLRSLREGDPVAVRQILDWMVLKGIKLNRGMYNLAIRAFAEAGEAEGAEEIFRRLQAAGRDPDERRPVRVDA
eukprot:g25700.t1